MNIHEFLYPRLWLLFQPWSRHYYLTVFFYLFNNTIFRYACQLPQSLCYLQRKKKLIIRKSEQNTFYTLIKFKLFKRLPKQNGFKLTIVISVYNLLQLIQTLCVKYSILLLFYLFIFFFVQKLRGLKYFLCTRKHLVNCNNLRLILK